MRPCLIASYGGSGSTFLAEILKSHYPQAFGYDHVHGVPEGAFLGVPIFNRYTGHSEGPFSRYIELPLHAKVIVIYRDPCAAYLSRACYKHFMHIWSDTPNMLEVFGDEEPNPKAFNQVWDKCKQEGRDVMRLADYLQKWRDYARTQRHDIAFIKYKLRKDVRT